MFQPCSGRWRMEPQTVTRLLDPWSDQIEIIGSLGPGRMAVVLSKTAAEQALSVTRDLAASYPAELEGVSCQVYAYCSHGIARKSHAGDSAEGSPTVLNMQSLFMLPLPWWKRLMDVIGGLVLLALLWPVILLAMLATRLSTAGPALFKQQRIGLGGKPFTMLKIRTMRPDAETLKEALLPHSEQDGPAFKMANDPRVTRLGRVLRMTSIDELPQLWNVLRGEMSLVGPRPLPIAEAQACLGWQSRRHDVTPGLTCIWQIAGRSQVTFDEWVRMDLAYIRSRTVLRDLLILVKTPPAMILRRGR